MATTFVKEETVASVKQLNCTSCGNALSVFNPRAKYISCQYCGSVLDANSEEHQILMSVGAPTSHQPLSFIKVGMVATFSDKKYQVIARTRWHQDYYEYWSEEGESGYSREQWVYDEWLMISEQRTYFYLVEDPSGYYISDEIVPTNPSLPGDSNRWSMMSNQREQIIKEYGAAGVVYFEGESNYQIKINDSIQFANYKHKNSIYTAEWRVDEATDQIKEIEFFKENQISKREVMKAFEANEELNVLRTKGEFWQWMTFGSGGLFVLFFILMLGTCGGGNKEVFKQQMSLASMNDEEGLVSNPMTLEKGVHTIELNGVLEQANQEAFILAYFMNEDEDVINYLEGDFAVYAGFDEDGYWEESQESNSKLVKVKEAGTYYAKIMADRDSTTTGSILLTVTGGKVISRYYNLGWIVFLIFGVVFYYRMKQYL